MHLIRYKPEFLEPMLTLHRSALKGFTLGMSQEQDEVDLVAVEDVYLRNRGEFLLGFVDEMLMAMGGFQRLSNDLAELRRMRSKSKSKCQASVSPCMAVVRIRTWPALPTPGRAGWPAWAAIMASPRALTGTASPIPS
jgi:hypothetical protein